jgi:hypothetical protein
MVVALVGVLVAALVPAVMAASGEGSEGDRSQFMAEGSFQYAGYGYWEDGSPHVAVEVSLGTKDVKSLIDGRLIAKVAPDCAFVECLDGPYWFYMEDFDWVMDLRVGARVMVRGNIDRSGPGDPVYVITKMQIHAPVVQ